MFKDERASLDQRYSPPKQLGALIALNHANKIRKNNRKRHITRTKRFPANVLDEGAMRPRREHRRHQQEKAVLVVAREPSRVLKKL